MELCRFFLQESLFILKGFKQLIKTNEILATEHRKNIINFGLNMRHLSQYFILQDKFLQRHRDDMSLRRIV